MVLPIHTKNVSNLTNRYWYMVLDGRMERRTDEMDGPTDAQMTPKLYSSDFVGG